MRKDAKGKTLAPKNPRILASVRVILFDFKKAFDLIDHRILVRKLGTYNIPDAVISWITDFLISRKQRVKLGLLFRMGRSLSGGSSRYKSRAVAVYHHDQRAGFSWARLHKTCT